MSQTTWVAEVQVRPLHLQPLAGVQVGEGSSSLPGPQSSCTCWQGLAWQHVCGGKQHFSLVYGEGKGEEWGERQWLWKGSVAFLAQTVAERRETVSSIERVEGLQGR